MTLLSPQSNPSKTAVPGPMVRPTPSAGLFVCARITAPVKRIAIFIYRVFRFRSVTSAMWLDSYDYATTKK